MRSYFRWCLFFTFVWWLVLLPKHFDLLGWLQPFRESVYWLLSLVFGQRPFYEDSSGMYLLLLAAPFFGLLTATLTFIPSFQNRAFSPGAAIRTLLLFFLIIELWEYGWIKLIKSQFYLPEPNTAYTELGALSKDIAYWSVIGSSRSYVVFMGIAELLAGTFLLFRRTRFVGLLLAFGIFANVCMVNFAFDISVKLFALSLLGMTVILLAGYPNQWRYLFRLPVKPGFERQTVGRPWKRWARSFVLALMVVETVYPTVMTGNLNDDAFPRPAFHGAYRVVGHPVWKRFYVHRHGYFIFEDRGGRQLDWKVTGENGTVYELLDERTGKTSKALLKPSENGLVLLWRSDSGTDRLSLGTLPYRELPLLQPSFHWTSDQFH